jgi:hypothetical protein
MMFNGEWYEDEAPAYTGATQQIPTIPQPITARRETRDYLTIGLAAIAAYIALHGFGIIGQSDRQITLAPPAPAAPAIVIEDNSWNWNVCGVCTDGNAASHFEIKYP